MQFFPINLSFNDLSSIKTEKLKNYISSLNPSSLSQSITPSHSSRLFSNSFKEQCVLEYVEKARRDFVVMFPNRRELLLSPLNEYNIPKFICTSITPLLLPFPEIYDLEPCCRFVSDFLEFSPLPEDCPFYYPSILPSLSTICHLRSGDCLDMSVLLVSLLLGAGYDAYCINGTAPLYITTADQSNVNCPFLESDKKDNNQKDANDEEILSEDQKKRYFIKKKTLLHHTLYNNELNKKEIEEKDIEEKYNSVLSFNDPSNIHNSDLEEEKYDQMDGHRVHVWVLVRSGKRDLPNDVFIEPSTGVIYQISESPYQSVDCVWNHQNYWMNLQESNVKEMKFKLEDDVNWEFIIVGKKEEKMDDDDYFLSDPKEIEKTTSEKEILDLPPGYWGILPIISRDVFIEKFPKGVKEQHFLKVDIFRYSPFYPKMKGLVTKIQIYEDIAKTKLIETRESYQQRQDHLLKKLVYHHPTEEKREYYYEPGRQLSSFISIGQSQRIYQFYPNSRPDHLVKRHEYIGVKYIEYYEKCDNLLKYRSVSSVKGKQKDDSLPISSSPDNIHYLKFGTSSLLPIRKIAEKYDRNPAVIADEDVAKITFFFIDGKILIDYHYSSDHITHSFHEYSKEEGVPVRAWQADPYYPQPTENYLRSKLQLLIKQETHLIHEAIKREEEFNGLLTTLKNEHEHTDLIKDLDQLAHDKAHQTDIYGIKDDDISLKNDPFAPFLANFTDNYELTLEECKIVYEQCCEALKNRLRERANIISKRIDQEKFKLKELKNQSTRLSEHGNLETEREIQSKIDECDFRKSILKFRYNRVVDNMRKKELAKREYELKEIARNHPRMKNLPENFFCLSAFDGDKGSNVPLSSLDINK